MIQEVSRILNSKRVSKAPGGDLFNDDNELR